MNIVAWPWQLDPHSRHIQHGSTGCSSWAARYSSCPISLSLCIYIYTHRKYHNAGPRL